MVILITWLVGWLNSITSITPLPKVTQKGREGTESQLFIIGRVEIIKNFKYIRVYIGIYLLSTEFMVFYP